MPHVFRSLVLSTLPMTLNSSKMIVNFTRATITVNVPRFVYHTFDNDPHALYEIHSLMMEWVQHQHIKRRALQFNFSFGLSNPALTDDVTALLNSRDTAALGRALMSTLSQLHVTHQK